MDSSLSSFCLPTRKSRPDRVNDRMTSDPISSTVGDPCWWCTGSCLTGRPGGGALLSGTARDGERPATYREVLSSREFRAVYAASTLSWVGDYLARAAVTALVFQTTHSVRRLGRRLRHQLRALAARRVGAGLHGRTVPVPQGHGLPVTSPGCCSWPRRGARPALPVILLLLLATALFSPPVRRRPLGDAAGDPPRRPVRRGSGAAHRDRPTGPGPRLLCRRLAGRRRTAPRPVDQCGHLRRAPPCFVRFGVTLRRPGLDQAHRSDLLRETVDGFRLVFLTPALRADRATGLLRLAVRGRAGGVGRGVGSPVDLGVEPRLESRDHHGGGAARLDPRRGQHQPAGLPPATRRRLLRPLAIVTPLALVPTIIDPPTVVVAHCSPAPAASPSEGSSRSRTASSSRRCPTSTGPGPSVWSRAVYSSSRAPRS